jgi:hypothetical protein
MKHMIIQVILGITSVLAIIARFKDRLTSTVRREVVLTGIGALVPVGLDPIHSSWLRLSTSKDFWRGILVGMGLSPVENELMTAEKALKERINRARRPIIVMVAVLRKRELGEVGYL